MLASFVSAQTASLEIWHFVCRGKFFSQNLTLYARVCSALHSLVDTFPLKSTESKSNRMLRERRRDLDLLPRDINIFALCACFATLQNTTQIYARGLIPFLNKRRVKRWFNYQVQPHVENLKNGNGDLSFLFNLLNDDNNKNETKSNNLWSRKLL